MAQVKATLKNYRQSPRKVRLVADFVRGKNVAKALTDLDFSVKKGATPLTKLIESAAANAKDRLGIEKGDLRVVSIAVDQGRVMKRRRPVARGRAHPIHKKSSHVTVVLEELEENVKKK